MFLLVACASQSAPTPTPVSSVTGTYGVSWANEAGCTLLAHELGTGQLRFYLECNRGAPSFNSGRAAGTLALANGMATWVETQWSGRCEIHFTFSQSRVEVLQQGTDAACGFGGFVNASGTYRRLDARVPDFPDPD